MTEREFNGESYHQFLREEKLMGSRCRKCGGLHLPPRPLCSHCGSADMEWAELKGKGTLAAFTAIAVGLSSLAEEGHDRNNPYCSGIVELEEGPRISARILGSDPKHPEGIPIGAPATIEFLKDKTGAIRPLVVFRV